MSYEFKVLYFGCTIGQLLLAGAAYALGDLSACTASLGLAVFTALVPALNEGEV